MTARQEGTDKGPSRPTAEELKAWRAAHWDGPFNEAKDRMCDALLAASVPSASRFPTLPCIPMMNAVIHAGGFGASPAQDEYVWKKMIEAAPKETPPEGASK